MAALADLSLCRLCFANEDCSEDGSFTRIRKFESLLSTLADVDISQAKDIPQRVCSNCEFQLESSLLLRKRVKFAENIWTKFQERQSNPGCVNEEPIMSDNELLLSCHLCTDSFDYQGLQSHLESNHGKDHVADCELCSLLLNQMIDETVRIAEQPIKEEQPVEEEEHCTETNFVDMDEHNYEDSETQQNDSLSEEDDVPIEEIKETIKSKANAKADRKYFVNKSGNKYPLHDCTFCGRSFHRPVKLRDHMAKHHPSRVAESSSSIKKDTVAVHLRSSSATNAKTTTTRSTNPVKEELDDDDVANNEDEEFLVEGEPSQYVEFEKTDEGRFACTKCDKTYLRKHGLQKHNETQHSENPHETPEYSMKIGIGDNRHYICNLCQVSFGRPAHLREHMQRKHYIEVPYIRTHKLRDGTALNNDTMNLSQEGSDIVPGTIKAKANTSEGLSNAEQEGSAMSKDQEEEVAEETVYEDTDYIAYSPEEEESPMEMDSDFVNIQTAEYIIKGPGKDRSFICNVCHICYSKSAKLIQHMQETHEFEMPDIEALLIDNAADLPTCVATKNHPDMRFGCSECDNTYTRRSKLGVHITKEHDPWYKYPIERTKKVAQFKCEECGKFYKTQHFLERHKLSHTIVKSPKVPPRYKASVHRKGSHPMGERFICEQCGKGFAFRHNLRNHIKRVHENCNNTNKMLLEISEPFIDSLGRKRRMYSCPECSEKFCRTNMLRRHFISKHNVPFPFKNRDKKFSKEKQFHYCPECGSTYNRLHRLREHMHKAHQIILPMRAKPLM